MLVGSPAMQLDASLSWLALGLTPGLAARLSARVLRRFDSPDGVFRAALPDLEACHLPAQVAQAIVKKEAFKRAEKELAGVQKIAGCTLLNWTEPEYPQSLLQIYDPPVLLYVRGDPQVLNLPSIDIVGTRRPTLYGTQMAQRLGRELAARGPVIVSGMARGIDAFGHQGAMDANGRAIGVLGTSIDVGYPKENQKLYEKVLERGAIISEFPLRPHPAPENFPVRNRIVAGMPLDVVVVEGAGDERDHPAVAGQAVQQSLAVEIVRDCVALAGAGLQT